MDTPIVNGKAYPVLHVAPAAYRFQILSAGNDRSWNLSWFLADATQNNTEVAMLPAAPPIQRAPRCRSARQSTRSPSRLLGIGTLPPDFWTTRQSDERHRASRRTAGRTMGRQPGIPAPQTMWAADGRAGGAPDPRNRRSGMDSNRQRGRVASRSCCDPCDACQLRTELRSITIGSVAVHGLWLGPAERADVIVDFSKFGGKTLILYNDGPSPAPAFDSRFDYFTGDGDQTPHRRCAQHAARLWTEHAHDHAGGCGRAISGNGKVLNLPGLKAAFASTATTKGVFASTQPTTSCPSRLQLGL